MSLAIYVRVSTQRQAQTQTIEQQLERLQAHIRNRGWELAVDPVFRVLPAALRDALGLS